MLRFDSMHPLPVNRCQRGAATLQRSAHMRDTHQTVTAIVHEWVAPNYDMIKLKVYNDQSIMHWYPENERGDKYHFWRLMHGTTLTATCRWLQECIDHPQRVTTHHFTDNWYDWTAQHVRTTPQGYHQFNSAQQAGNDPSACYQWQIHDDVLSCILDDLQLAQTMTSLQQLSQAWQQHWQPYCFSLPAASITTPLTDHLWKSRG